MGAGYERKIKVLVAKEEVISVYSVYDWLEDAKGQPGVIAVLGYADEDEKANDE